ncbi:unnamed protein product [Chrysoparadoxa australica]
MMGVLQSGNNNRPWEIPASDEEGSEKRLSLGSTDSSDSFVSAKKQEAHPSKLFVPLAEPVSMSDVGDTPIPPSPTEQFGATLGGPAYPQAAMGSPAFPVSVVPSPVQVQVPEQQPVVEVKKKPVLRSACDFCTKRKRRCNGKKPCHNCIDTGVECVYSEKQKSGRKKRPRLPDGTIIQPGTASGAMVANNKSFRLAPSSEAGMFSPSGAVGLVGHMENAFMATYLRDFNTLFHVTSEESVMKGLLEIMAPSIQGVGTPASNAIQSVRAGERHGRIALFWAVVMMGSKILGAPQETVQVYRENTMAALKECFDCQDRDVVQSYVLLSIYESTVGDKARSARYLQFARTMHNSLMGMSPDPVEDTAMKVVFRTFTECGEGEESGEEDLKDLESAAQTGSSTKALAMIGKTYHLARDLMDPEVPCSGVKDRVLRLTANMNNVRNLMHSQSRLESCISSLVSVSILDGVTTLMRNDWEGGLAKIECGVEYAMTRPGLMTLPQWWHLCHLSAIIFIDYNRPESYQRLRETYNRVTFEGTALPPPEEFTIDQICTTGCCQALAGVLARIRKHCARKGCESQQGTVYQEDGSTQPAPTLDAGMPNEDLDFDPDTLGLDSQALMELMGADSHGFDLNWSMADLELPTDAGQVAI